MAIRITNTLEKNMPAAGLLTLVDPETGKSIYAPTSFRSFNKDWQQWQEERSEFWLQACIRYKIPHLEIDSMDNIPATLARFFRKGSGS
jgi:hypothetical protein